MLKFFRKIRKSLIKSGSIRKYLLYAIGEIALVMIGILLALQVNNWNQRQQNKRQEKLILHEINEEFLFNKEDFQQTLNQYDGIRGKLKKLRSMFPIDPQTIEIDTIITLLDGTNFTGDFDYSTTTIEKLKSMGTLDLISNEEMRNLLLRFEVLVTDYTKEESFALNYHENEYAPIMERKLPRPYEIKLKDSRVDLSFLGTIEFEYLIQRKISKINNLFRIAEEKENNKNILKVMERIIELSR